MLENINIMQLNLNISNVTTLTRSKTNHIFSYISLIIIILGLIGNTTTFIIFRFNNEMKKIPSMVILSFVCITDTLSLFTWNLNYFTYSNFGFNIEGLNIYTCRIFTFIQYFGLQSSGLLLSLVSIDRYIFVSRLPNSFLSKLPFGTLKSATLWSFSIVSIIGLMNSFILILDRKVILNTVHCYHLSNGFIIPIMWEKVHMILYCLIPFILMIIFDVLLIKKTLNLKSNSYSKNQDKSKRKNLTFSLLFITFSFIIMILPAQICFTFFLMDFIYDEKLNFILTTFDYLSFFNNCSIFFSCFITNIKFRNIVYGSIKIIICTRKIK